MLRFEGILMLMLGKLGPLVHTVTLRHLPPAASNDSPAEIGVDAEPVSAGGIFGERRRLKARVDAHCPPT